jgi:hypothetical protein
LSKRKKKQYLIEDYFIQSRQRSTSELEDSKKEARSTSYKMNEDCHSLVVNKEHNNNKHKPQQIKPNISMQTMQPIVHLETEAWKALQNSEDQFDAGPKNNGERIEPQVIIEHNKDGNTQRHISKILAQNMTERLLKDNATWGTS